MNNTQFIEDDELPENLSDIESEIMEADDYSETPPKDIIAFTEMRSGADLYRMYKAGQLDINPDFQREVVWKPLAQSRFIDSLVKGLPIPSLCFCVDSSTEQRIVIDGLQRISSIINFLREDQDWKLVSANDIDENIGNKKVSDIKALTPKIYARVQNATLPITVLYCDLRNAGHKQYLFTIFHRLNTTGIKLNNQEIRNAIYQGALNDLLNKCNENANWINILKIDKTKQYRFSKQELILRFFAFYDLAETYKVPLTRFLNTYMDTHQKANPRFIRDKQILFERTIKVIDEKLVILEKNSNVVIESLLVGCAQNIDFIETLSASDFENRFSTLLLHTAYAPNNMQSGLYQQDKLSARLAAAVLHFSPNFQAQI